MKYLRVKPAAEEIAAYIAAHGAAPRVALGSCCGCYARYWLDSAHTCPAPAADPDARLMRRLPVSHQMAVERWLALPD